MMKKTMWKNIFFIASALYLILMLFLSRDAGISCDDNLHYDHSVDVYNYFATHGSDRSALETPVTHLKYYGQAFDNAVTFLIKWFDIEDVYSFRHLMSSLSGWLAVFITALFGIWISGYRTGLLILFLFAVSPTFTGHSMNNLKDIPFALAYIAGIFFTLKLLENKNKMSWKIIAALIISIGFAIGIRPVGILLICYLFLFWFILRMGYLYRNGGNDIRSGKAGNGQVPANGIRARNFFPELMVLIFISGAGFFLGTLLWPYALQAPVKNVLQSYHFMSHFPGTFRQIFEGSNEWSDFMPWYFIPKSMLITIPLIVTAGTVFFLIFAGRAAGSGKLPLYLIIIFTILFPLIFVIVKQSNLYSSWRQFLFLYPPLILIAASGLDFLYKAVPGKYSGWLITAVIMLMGVHPLSYMIRNHPYEYMYFNQITGGLKGAYGNYETDYYYVSQTEASEWLISYLNEKGIDSALVGATYPVKWQFRKYPGIKTFYFRHEERSQYNWDYAIITNRYIQPCQLKNGIWPPPDPLHTIYSDGVPIGIVVERKNKDDFYGYRALEEKRPADAVRHFETALRFYDKDEMIFYNFARALYDEGYYERADSVLKKGLEINPYCEPILMYLGNIAKYQGNTDEALKYYESLVNYNRKYFQAWVEMAGLFSGRDNPRARKLLRDCLRLNPRYRPAIIALADTYREEDPERAKRYYEMAETIK
jgi:tetratricopeptide (TPR) repeat protein